MRTRLRTIRFFEIEKMVIYCVMTSESRNGGAGVDVHC
jgi:hypothetical protein